MESRIHVNYSLHCKIKFLILIINFTLYGWISMESRIYVNYSLDCEILLFILKINFTLYEWITMESRNHVVNYSPYINLLA